MKFALAILTLSVALQAQTPVPSVKLSTQPLTAAQAAQWQAANDAITAAQAALTTAQNNLTLARQKVASLQTVILIEAGAHNDPCVDGMRSFKRGQIDSGVLVIHEGTEVCETPRAQQPANRQ